MTLTESFNKWLARIDHAGLPWQTSKDELLDIFTAGFHAGVESTRQVDLWAGTLSQDLRPAGVTGLAHRTCNAEESVRAGCGAEDVYAAFPRKQGKLAALKAITKAAGLTKDQGGYEYLLKQTKAFAAAVASWPESEKQFCPMPATFFNQGRYMDDQKLWQRFSPTSQFKEVR